MATPLVLWPEFHRRPLFRTLEDPDDVRREHSRPELRLMDRCEMHARHLANDDVRTELPDRSDLGQVCHCLMSFVNAAVACAILELSLIHI